MSPIDDELRAALHGRASVLAPSPDPLAGIERRANRIRRNRAAAAVAGAALAVAAVAVAVPVLTPFSAPAPTGPATEPTLQQSPAPAESPYVLDPTNPWPYRGDPDLAVQDDLDAYTAQWAVRHGTLTDDVDLVPLFGQVYEPSGLPEVFYLVTQRSTGEHWWGVAKATGSGPELVVDQSLPAGTKALSAALPGDEVARLLVVASPDVEAIEYGANDATEFAPMIELADGVAINPLDGDRATDQVRVLAPGGEAIFVGPAPDPDDSVDPPAAGQPTNLLTHWPIRGDGTGGPPEQDVLDAFASAVKTIEPEGQPQFRPLFVGSSEAGLSYTVGQAWMPGRQAYPVSFTTGGESGPVFFIGPVTEPNPVVLAFSVCCAPGTTTDTLVVVPEPGTGQVDYAASDGAAFEPAGVGQDSLYGVVLIDRDPRAQSDRIRLLDGNGDLDNPTFEGPVFNLLCALNGCG